MKRICAPFPPTNPPVIYARIFANLEKKKTRKKQIENLNPLPNLHSFRQEDVTAHSLNSLPPIPAILRLPHLSRETRRRHDDRLVIVLRPPLPAVPTSGRGGRGGGSGVAIRMILLRPRWCLDLRSPRLPRVDVVGLRSRSRDTSLQRRERLARLCGRMTRLLLWKGAM